MASAPVAVRNQYGALFGEQALPVLEELFMESYEEQPMVRERIFDVRSTQNDIWQSQDIDDLPLMSQIPEGSEYTYSKPNQGGTKTFKPLKYGGGFAISRELMEDAKFSVMAEWARKLGKSARASQEIMAMNVLNNGFTSELAQDGLSLFNASHVIAGTTFSNVITGNPDLSPSSLEAAIAQFKRAFINGMGAINSIKPTKLVVAPENYLYALEITESVNRADTADNNINSIRMANPLEVISSPYLTDPDAWFLSADPSETGLKLVTRQGIRTEVSTKEVGFHTDSIFYKMSYREAVGVSRAQGILGSSGAA